MNKKALFFILIFILLRLVLAVSPASAAAPQNECQPGAENHVIGSWELMNVQEYAELLEELFPGREGYYERAQATFDFCDHNNDGSACVMVQSFPVTAALVVDNHPYGGN